MNQLNSAQLLPVEYYRSIETPEFKDDDANQFLKSIIELEDQKDEFVQQIDSHSYAIPIKTALFLYRRNPQQCRNFVVRAIGWGTNAYYFQSLAATAQEAFHAKDYYLLGILAFHFESSQSELNSLSKFKWSGLMEDLGHVEISDQKSDSLQLMEYFRSTSIEKVTSKLEVAFHRALLRSHQHITAEQLSNAACGYFMVMPRHFVFPPEDSKGENSTWMILNSFLAEPTELLLLNENIQSEWENLSHPVLIDKVKEQVPAQNIDLSAIDENVRNIRNPFAKIANKLGAEPKKKRPLAANDRVDNELELEVENNDLPAESVSQIFAEAEDIEDKDEFEDVDDEAVSTSGSWKFWQRKE